MRIINDSNSRKIQVGNLLPGDVFRDDNCYYLVAENIEDEIFYIDLETGLAGEFSVSAYVQKVEAELHVVREGI